MPFFAKAFFLCFSFVLYLHGQMNDDSTINDKCLRGIDMTYDNIVTGTFLKRPNRFIAYVE